MDQSLGSGPRHPLFLGVAPRALPQAHALTPWPLATTVTLPSGGEGTPVWLRFLPLDSTRSNNDPDPAGALSSSRSGNPGLSEGLRSWLMRGASVRESRGWLCNLEHALLGSLTSWERTWKAPGALEVESPSLSIPLSLSEAQFLALRPPLHQVSTRWPRGF